MYIDKTKIIFVILLILISLLRPVYMKYVMPKLSEKIAKILTIIGWFILIETMMYLIYVVFFS